MSTRRRAREVVLQLLYVDDLNPDQDPAAAEEFLRGRLHNNEKLVEFARSLWRGVLDNRWELDREIGARAANWSVRRMAAIDRNIIRLAAYEILKEGTPGGVAISEAVELAKRYGNSQSSQFVNGILDRILNASEGEVAAETDELESRVTACTAEPGPVAMLPEDKEKGRRIE